MKSSESLFTTDGQYLSDAIVETILETPEGVALGGETRKITILMADLRGFTAISEQLPAKDVVRMLNIFLEAMTEIILKYQGMIDEFIGDAILALFGVPVLHNNDPQRAVACAVEMQLAIEMVNAQFRELGYPEVAMGIGMNTGDVIVGNIGSIKRVKYGVVGSAVNVTGRIESYTVGGQILIAPTTHAACGDLLRIGSQFEISPKGVQAPIMVSDVTGIGGDFQLFLPTLDSDALHPLRSPLKVRIYILEQKHIGGESADGEIIELGKTGASIRSTRNYRVLTNLKLTVFAAAEGEITHELYAKVIKRHPSLPATFRISFTFIPTEVKAFFQDQITS